jgi:hypothetical protein
MTVVSRFLIQDAPIIVKLVEPQGDPTGLADTLLRALGLTGVLTLLALGLGLLMAGVLFFVRSRRPLQ